MVFAVVPGAVGLLEAYEDFTNFGIPILVVITAGLDHGLNGIIVAVVEMTEFLSVENLGVVFEVANGGGDPFGVALAAELCGVGTSGGAGDGGAVTALIAESTGRFIPNLVAEVTNHPFDGFGGDEDSGLPG